MIVLDTETTNKIENTDKRIMCQLAFYNSETNNYYTTYTYPEEDFSIESMEVHGITPETIQELYCEEVYIDTMDNLKKLNTRDNIILGHNISFDIEVLRREGVNIQMKVIDTFKIAKFINDSTANTLWSSTRLSYLKYYYRLDNLNTNNKQHDALSDVQDTWNLWLKLKEEFNISEEQALELCSKPMLINHCPFGKNVGVKWTNMNYNQRKWYYETGDEDIVYSLDKLGLI